jgi:hypothetical protein
MSFGEREAVHSHGEGTVTYASPQGGLLRTDAYIKKTSLHTRYGSSAIIH